MNSSSNDSAVIAREEPASPLQAADSARINLLGLSPSRMVAFFESIGEKKFRAQQVMKWIHQQGVTDFDQMTNLSKSLRERLKALADVRLPEVVQQYDSADGTRKWLIRLDGGNCIETVFIPVEGRGTLCVSSQIGCSLDCSFCATGKQGFNRDLTTAEIVAQLWLAAKSFGSFEPKANRTVTNVVLMGMGEPLLNFDNVVDAVNLMMDDFAYGLSKRRVTLSTSGVVPQLDRLADFTDVSLAVSLHAPNDALRNELVPLNKKYPIAMLLESVRNYLRRLPDNHRRATIEYTLIDGVNDKPEHARQLAELLRDVPCKINLIPFNPFNGVAYQKVSEASLKRFSKILFDAGYTVTVRATRGDDIAAACGQLAGEVNDRTRRSQRYHQQSQQQSQSQTYSAGGMA